MNLKLFALIAGYVFAELFFIDAHGETKSQNEFFGDRKVFARFEKIKIPMGNEKCEKLQLRDVSDNIYPLPYDVKDSQFIITLEDFKPGIYKIEAIYEKKATPLKTIQLCDIVDAPVRFGLFGLPSAKDIDETRPGKLNKGINSGELDIVLNSLKSLKMNHFMRNFNIISSDKELHIHLEASLKNGWGLCEGLNLWLAPYLDDTMNSFVIANKSGLGRPLQDKWGSTLSPSGNYGQDNKAVCFNRPFVRDKIKLALDKAIRQVKGYPSLFSITLNDEYGLAKELNGDGLGCFCEDCVKIFKDKTGLEAPLAKQVPTGKVIPNNDPLLLYIKYLGISLSGDQLSENNKRNAMYLQNMLPETKVMTTQGGVQGELDLVCWEHYSNIFQKDGNGLIWAQTSLLSDFLARTARIEQIYKEKPLSFCVGWYDGPGPSWTAKEWSLNTKLLLINGVQELILAPGRALRFKPFYEKAGKLGRLIEQYGPIFQKLKPIPGKLAVLHSETTQAFQFVLPWDKIKNGNKDFVFHPWKQKHYFDCLWPALKKSGLAVDLISEKDVRENGLDRYSGLLIVNAEYLPQDIYNIIHKKISSGYPVYIDKSTTILFPGSQKLPFEISQWYEYVCSGKCKKAKEISMEKETERVYQDSFKIQNILTKNLQKQFSDKYLYDLIENDRTDVGTLLFRNGETYYLALVNDSPFREIESNVKWRGKGNIYNIFTGENTVNPIKAAIQPLDWKVFIITPRPLDHLGCSVSETSGGNWQIKTTFYDKSNLCVDGCFPVFLEILDPKGNVSRFSRYMAADQGQATLPLSFATNDLKGAWIIKASSPLVKKSAQLKIIN
jgi:hypothetical protein